MDLAKIRKKASRKLSVKETRERKKSAQEDIPPPEAPPGPADTPSPPSQQPVAAPARQAPPAIPEPGKTQPGSQPADVIVSVENLQPQSEDYSRSDKDRKIEKLLVFKVGRNRYGIPIGDLSQIIEDRSLTPLPFVPPFLKGIFSLRGHIVGVIDVALRLRLDGAENVPTKKIVVLEKDGDLFGLKVDGIEHVVEVDILTLEAPPESFDPVSQEFVLGVFHYKNKTVAFLNLAQFLDFDVTWRN